MKMIKCRQNLIVSKNFKSKVILLKNSRTDKVEKKGKNNNFEEVSLSDCLTCCNEGRILERQGVQFDAPIWSKLFQSIRYFIELLVHKQKLLQGLNNAGFHDDVMITCNDYAIVRSS